MRSRLVTLVVVVSVVCVGGASRGDLRLVNNGYEGLVVTITDDVPQQHCNHVVQGLKAVLRELSRQMWTATEGRASLREVTVALPRAWRTDALTCSLPKSLPVSTAPAEGHIRVTTPHPVFGSRPWTQQSQGCGLPGDFIHVGEDMLKADSAESHTLTSRLLLAEWAKFRWGVFDERGHTNDPLYPSTFRDPDTNQWVATGCADGSVKGTTCDSSQSGCSFLPEPHANNHLASSLLAFPDFPSVRRFCKEKNHNKEAPTKHNSLCGSRSAWEVIEQTPDFAGGRNTAANTSGQVLEPLLKLVQAAGPTYVFAIEDTAAMNLQRRWEFLRKAMRRVVVYDVPNGAHVGVITFNSAGRTVAPLTFIDSEDSDMRQRVGSSLPRNPSAVRESQKCILCGLQQVLKVLGNDKKFGKDAVVILITTGSSPTSEEDVAKMISLAEQNNLRIEVVLYPLTEHRGTAPTYHGLETLVKATRGSIFTVMDEGVGNDSKLKMMVALMDALLAAVQSSVPPSSPGGPVLVHSADYPGGIASVSAGNFALDDSLGSDARFSVYYYDLNHVGNAIHLTAPSGHMIASVNVQEEDGDVNMIFINLGKAERGQWKYSVENRADSHQGLYVQVTARRNTSTGLAVRLWTSSGTRFLNYSDPTSAAVVFMEVRAGMAPIMDARVVATLQRLGTNETGSNYEPMFFNLWDNGAGDPDITRGDGVYSRYLPRLAGHPGRYLLSATVDHNDGRAVVAQGPPSRPRVPLPPRHLPLYFHQPDLGAWGDPGTCCGSSLFYFHSRTAPPFQRHLTFGVLEVLSSPNQRDLTPPSRILDLRVEVNDTVHEIFLRWTAPGDDWDVGSAHHYQAVVAPQWEEARAFQGDTLTGLPRPLRAGTLHTTNLHFIRYEELWYVSMRAVDAAGNKGPLGNIAALWVPRPPTTYEITTRTHPSFTTLGNYAMPSELGSGRPLGMTELRAEDVAVIVGSLGGFLVVAAALASYCYCHTLRRRKQPGKHEDVKTVVHGGNGSDGGGSADVSLAIKTESAVSEGARGSHESIHSSTNDNTSRKPLDVVSHSSAQSWGTATFPRENGADLTGEPLATFSSLDGRPPFPDVTVTDYQQVPAGGGQTSLHMSYVHEKAAGQYEVPSLAYSNYNPGWEEPLTSHLLSQVHTAAPTPAPQQPPLPQADRKRRNVTQV